MKRFLLPLLFLTSCGYHISPTEKISVSVPYVIGDHEGALTDALASAISNTSQFRYSRNDGEWILQAKVVDTDSDRIGYRFNREEKSSDIPKKDNIVGIENRKTISVEVSVENATTGKLIISKQTIKASADYDYTDPNALVDVSFINPRTGTRDTSIAFSLGQLDSVAAAGEDAIYPVYKKLAQIIVDGLILSGEMNEE